MIPFLNSRRDENSSQLWVHSERKLCVRTPTSSAGCTSMPSHGETGVVYVTERVGGGGRLAGGSLWWGAQPGFPTASAALKPPTQGHCRRGRGTIRSGSLAVRAALPAARVDGLGAEGISFSLLFPAKDNRVQYLPHPRFSRFLSVLRVRWWWWWTYERCCARVMIWGNASLVVRDHRKYALTNKGWFPRGKSRGVTSWWHAIARERSM